MQGFSMSNIKEKITCSTCVNCLAFMNNNGDDYDYCLEFKNIIPVGTDPGQETQCKKWIKRESTILFKKDVLTGGAKAKAHGEAAIKLITGILTALGCQVREHAQFPILTIWKQQIIVDVFCQGFPLFPEGLIIESMWQDSPGSAYHKIPYNVANINETYPFPTVLIIDGSQMKDGVRREAVIWAKAKVTNNNLIAVFSFEEFIRWLFTHL